MLDLRMQIFRHLQRLPLSFYDRNPIGRLMTRVTNDVDVLNELFTSGVITVFGDVFLLIGIVIAMSQLDVELHRIARRRLAGEHQESFAVEVESARRVVLEEPLRTSGGERGARVDRDPIEDVAFRVEKLPAVRGPDRALTAAV